MDGTARDCEPQLMALFMKSPKLTMFYRKFFFRFGKRHIVIHPKQASRSDGWSPSPVVARLTGCAAWDSENATGVRLAKIDSRAKTAAAQSVIVGELLLRLIYTLL